MPSHQTSDRWTRLGICDCVQPMCLTAHWHSAGSQDPTATATAGLMSKPCITCLTGSTAAVFPSPVLFVFLSSIQQQQQTHCTGELKSPVVVCSGVSLVIFFYFLFTQKQFTHMPSLFICSLKSACY